MDRFLKQTINVFNMFAFSLGKNVPIVRNDFEF